jgi:DNA-binding NarL/FixJ family response regulator
MPITIALTDDHPLAINGIKNMLLADKNIDVTGTYENAASLLAGLKNTQPDILLLDILLPDSKGSELTAHITREYPDIKIIAITSLDAPSHVKSMTRAGCKGYLLKNTDQRKLLHAIYEVYEGREYIEPSLLKEMMDNMLQFKKISTPQDKPASLSRLSTREREVLQLIIQEYSNREIADKLSLSLRTVQNHFFNLCQKLEVKNAVGLVKIAIQMGLVNAKPDS